MQQIAGFLIGGLIIAVVIRIYMLIVNCFWEKVILLIKEKV